MVCDPNQKTDLIFVQLFFELLLFEFAVLDKRFFHLQQFSYSYIIWIMK